MSIPLLIFCIAVFSHFNVRGAPINNTPNSTDRLSYWPMWNELDTRPLPEWYDSAKIGIFIHWGVYSVPSFIDEWFWYHLRTGVKRAINFVKRNYGDHFTYKDFAPMFQAEKFDPDAWAHLFSKSGARYVILTSKHHDGFALFPSRRLMWNSVDVGPKQDIVGNLSKSIRKYGMKFGVYYSLMEWFNDWHIEDLKSFVENTVYTDTILLPDIKFLVNNYKPSVIWADGNWVASDTYFKSPKLLAWLYNESPVRDEVVVNDRWGKNTSGNHGGFYNYDDRFNPRKLMPHKWENAFTLDKKSWGYRRDMRVEDVLSFDQLLENVVSTVSCGGNALINVGPTKEGIIAPIFQDRLLQLGNWLNINGEAIYKTSPWIYQRDSLNKDVWYTCSKIKKNQRDKNRSGDEMDYIIQAVYAIFLKWPVNNKLKMKDLFFSNISSQDFQMYLINTSNTHFVPVNFQNSNDVLEVHLPSVKNNMEAWVLKIVELE